MRGRMAWAVLALSALGAWGCSDTESEGGDEQVTQSVTQTVGAAGGTVELGGAKLVFPAGALAVDTDITVAKGVGEAPAGYLPQSDVFEFSPSGLEFAQPVQLTLGFTGSADNLRVYLSARSGTGYETIGGTVSGQDITAPITHFSRAFAGTSTVSSSIRLEDLETELPTLYCHVYTVCGFMSSVDGCLGYFDAAFAQQGGGFDFTEQRRAVAAGRLTFNAEKAGECKAAVLAMNTCTRMDPDNVFDSIPACAEVFVGKVATGADCYHDSECVPGNVCNASDQTCPGTCRPTVAENGTVTPGDACADGLEVYNGVCQAKVAVGQSCAAVSPETYARTCVEGAYCSSSTETCVALKAQGESCVGRDECAPGFTCSKSGKQEVGTCQKLAVADGACDYSTNLGCTLDLVCVLSAPAQYAGTCKARGATGATCYHHTMCQPELHCTGNFEQAGTCVADLAVGTSCTNNDECAPSAFCDSNGQNPSETCTARRPASGVCFSDTECEPGLSCDSNVCVAEQRCVMP